MPNYVVKPSRDEDFYVYWSDIIDEPAAWGDRRWMTEHLTVEHRYGKHDLTVAERMEWADTHGTSACWPGGEAGYCYGWDDDGMVYLQQGWLRRDRLKALCERLGEDRLADVRDLLEPFADQDEE